MFTEPKFWDRFLPSSGNGKSVSLNVDLWKIYLSYDKLTILRTFYKCCTYSFDYLNLISFLNHFKYQWLSSVVYFIKYEVERYNTKRNLYQYLEAIDFSAPVNNLQITFVQLPKLYIWVLINFLGWQNQIFL